MPGLSGLTATYEPFLQGAVIHIDQNRYVETALNAGLVGAAHGYDLGTTTLGLRTQYQLASLPGFTWTSLLGWRHAYGDVIPKVNQTFAGSFSSFTVAGVPIDRDAFVSETSLDYAVSQRRHGRRFLFGPIWTPRLGHRLQGPCRCELLVAWQKRPRLKPITRRDEPCRSQESRPGGKISSK